MQLKMTTATLSSDFSNLLTYIAGHSESHGYQSGWYQELSQLTLEGFLPKASEAMHESRSFDLGEIKALNFPWVSFGSINSGHLFGLDEIILFSFYWSNRTRYSQFLDLGANIGLHSAVALKLGLNVTSVEPDPEHVKLLKTNLEATEMPAYRVIEGAATVSSGPLTFTRVEGNTTGSHVKGAKKNPYGVLTEFEVEGYPVTELVAGKDLVKMDVEGLEADLLESLFSSGFQGYDVVAEIGSESSAERIWHTARAAEVNVFSQKANWSVARNQTDLPHHHTQGSVFLSRSESMAWL
jgi:FkbM family methyltransferase